MNLWMLLFLAVLGMFIFQLATYFALEREHSIPDPIYYLLVTFAMMGAFLSAISLTKIVREIDESKLKQIDI